MTTELTMLTWTVGLTGLLWLPYIIAQSKVSGTVGALGYGYKGPLEPLPAWAERAKAHHHNAVENLVLFAALVITAHLAEATNEATASAAIAYFWLRAAHYAVFTANIPFARTLTFAGSWLAQVCILYQILIG